MHNYVQILTISVQGRKGGGDGRGRELLSTLFLLLQVLEEEWDRWEQQSPLHTMHS